MTPKFSPRFGVSVEKIPQRKINDTVRAEERERKKERARKRGRCLMTEEEEKAPAQSVPQAAGCYRRSSRSRLGLIFIPDWTPNNYLGNLRMSFPCQPPFSLCLQKMLFFLLPAVTLLLSTETAVYAISHEKWPGTVAQYNKDRSWNRFRDYNSTSIIWDGEHLISRHSQGVEGIRFGGLRIASLLFADDVVLLASSVRDLQLSLERFAAECEAAGMAISASKSEAMVLSRKRVECLLRVRGGVLPQVEEFKYLGILFTNGGRREREIDRRIGAASAVKRALYRSVVVKRELSQKAKLSIYRSIYVPTLIYGPELWVMTERTRSRIQAAEMGFLRRVAGLSLRERVRSSVIREGLRVEPLLLHVERGQLRWLGHLVRMPHGRLPGEVFRARPTGRRPRGRPRTRWRDDVSRLA
ncbi:hypothetical protein CCH79_00006096 [Gambusia affinis]|uniref:Uncharacterized protein n=1 Tax=Gambusia affinis TaxID=33528 RepID=A0A315VWA5_GAMAF|nr:hypothetical protein CCH79_00006096 [Gambusia affinis]